MEPKIFQKPLVSLPLIVILNTVAMTWVGGIEHFQEQKPLLSGLFFLMIYLALCEAWQLIGRNMYYHKQQFTWAIYGGKLLASFILIVIIACQSRFAIGILLALYELYQALLYRNNWNYMEMAYFPLMNGFFKGFIINIILAVGTPFQFSITGLLPYALPVILFMMQAILYQIMYTSYAQRNKYFMGLTLLAGISVLCLILIAWHHPWEWLALLVFVVYVAGLLYVFKETKKKRLEQELYISLFILLSMMTCCSW